MRLEVGKMRKMKFKDLFGGDKKSKVKADAEIKTEPEVKAARKIKWEPRVNKAAAKRAKRKKRF